jgi:DNA polymerase
VLLFLDFETYYDQAYSLRQMTPAEYILDERFETICLGAAFNGNNPRLIDGPDIGKFLKEIDPAKTVTVTYNALFDNSILAWRYNFVPHRMVDALGMARSLLGHRLRKFGLADVADCIGVGQKGDVLQDVKGMHREEIQRDKDLWDRFGSYCLNDTTLLREIFIRLHSEFPQDEYAVMDSVLRCCIEPRLHCDVPLLEQHLRALRDEKARLCDEVGASKEVISGNQTFLRLLHEAGVEIETKEGKRGPIPAIAKTDKFMVELLEHERPEVQCLAAARLGVKSTLEESRCERLIRIASLPWPITKSLMPIPLRYSGAHTWRLSGDWKINMQNLPSARMGDPVLRRSLMAPPGHKIVVGDLAQIEARLNARLWGGKLLDQFKNHQDPYAALASVIFDMPVDKQTLDGVARHIGKAGILGCGYGMGPEKFYDSVLRQSRSMLKPHQMEKLHDLWTPSLARKSVETYRRENYTIQKGWWQLDSILKTGFLAADWCKPEPEELDLGISIGHRNGYGYVRGPGGREMRYGSPKFVVEDNRSQLYYFNGGIPHKIYGAALLENIIQFLARIVQMEIAERIRRDLGLRFAHQVHDELVYVVPDDVVEGACFCIADHMRTPPDWCADLPLEAEVTFGQRYGDCK